MTAKEKAEELVDKFYTIEDSKEDNDAWIDVYLAKQCALLAAENIRTEMVQAQNYERAIYWRDVKSQIKML